MGQNFSWIEKVGHRLEQQRVRRQRAGVLYNEDGRICVENERICFCKPIKGEAKPRRPTSAFSSTRTVPICERRWTDVEPGAQFDEVYPVAKRLNIFLRHGELPREEDGAIEFWRLKDDLRNKFENSQHWSDEMWKSKMQGGGGNKKIFQYCTDPSGQEILCLRALQGHSGCNPIDPTLQDNVLTPNNFFEYICQIGCAISLHFITKSVLIAGGQNLYKERQTVFFTAVNPMNKNHKDPQELDLTKPRFASYKQKWKRHQDTVYWVDIQLAQRKGLKFYQTRSNVILYDTLPAYCISKVIVMKSEEITFQKVYVSPRPPPNISYKDKWMCDLDSDLAGSSKDTQRIEPKPKTKLSSTGRPVCGQESTKRCVLTPKHVEEDQTGTERPVEEHEIDFSVPGLSHAVVKEAEHLRVQEPVKKIENHPHREAFMPTCSKITSTIHSAKSRRR